MGIGKLWRSAAEEPRREQVRSFNIDFPFSPTAGPFSLSVTHGRASPVFGHTLEIRASGAQHPHDPDCETGFIGDLNKNPALLPAIQLLREKLPAIATAAMQAAGIDNRSMDLFDAHRNDGKPSVENHSGGVYCLLRFNPRHLFYAQHNYAPATDRQVDRLYSELITGVDKLKPAIRQSVEDNKYLHPGLPLGYADTAPHQTSLGLERTRAMLAAGMAIVAHDPEDAAALMKLAGKDGLPEAYVVQPGTGGAQGLWRGFFKRHLG